MTNEEIIATFRAEIERLLTKWESANAMAEDLLSILSDLEKSLPQVTDSEGPEEEIERYLPKIPENPYNEELRVFARHFYELGCRRAAEKYDEIEYNRQRASGSSEIPNDAKVAAEQFYQQDSFDTQAARELGIACFVDGAKWDKEQMMKEAVEGRVISNDGISFPVSNEIHRLNLMEGDKVRIIIVKKD